MASKYLTNIVPGPLLVTVADGASIALDMSQSTRFIITLGGTGRTLTLFNVVVGMSFSIILKQDGTGSRTVTWFSGISWPGGTVPTLTTTINKSDIFTFICTGSGAYLGMTAGLNL